MSVTVTARKRISFKSPYTGATFQGQAEILLGRDGYFSGAKTSDDGATITVLPFTFVQRGIIGESLENVVGLAVPTDPEPWFLLAAMPDDDPDSGIIVSVTTDLALASNSAIIAFKTGGRWKNPHSVNISGAAETALSADTGYEEGFELFETVDGSSNVDKIIVGRGQLVDPDGDRRTVSAAGGESFRAFELDPIPSNILRDRTDFIALRQRESFSPEIVHILGGTLKISFSSPSATKTGATRASFFSKRGDTQRTEEWLAWGDGTSLKIQGGRAGAGFAETTLLTGGGTVSNTWIAGQRASDDAVILLYTDGDAVRMVSFNPTTGAKIDTEVTIDTEPNAAQRIRASIDNVERLYVVYQHDDGALEQIYYTRVLIDSATFGVPAGVSPRIVAGASTSKNDTWPDIAVDRKGFAHIVYTSGTGSNEFGDFVYAVFDPDGNLDSLTTYLVGSKVGVQADKDDSIGFVSVAFDDVRRARVAVTPHDEVYACMLGTPTATGTVDDLLLFNPELEEQVGFPIVNATDVAPAGEYVTCDIAATEAGDLRIMTVDDPGGDKEMRVVALDTRFASDGRIGRSLLYDLLIETVAGTVNAQTEDGIVGLVGDGDVFYVRTLGTTTALAIIGSFPGTTVSRPTPHPRDIYLAGAYIPSGSTVDIPRDEGFFRIFNTRPKKLNYPFLVGDRGGEYSGFDGIHEAVRAASLVGGTVVIRPGRYHLQGLSSSPLETLTIGTGVSLVGEGRVILERASLQVGAGTAFTVASISTSVISTNEVITPATLKKGDYINMTGGGATGFHRVLDVLPPGSAAGRILVDSNRTGASPGGTGFVVYATGQRIENLAINQVGGDHLRLEYAWGALIRGISILGTITNKVAMFLENIHHSVVEDIDFTEFDPSGITLGLGRTIELSTSEWVTLRDIKKRDDDARIFIQEDADWPTLLNIRGDSSLAKTLVQFDGPRTTPVLGSGIESQSNALVGKDYSNATLVGRVIDPRDNDPEADALALEDVNTRAAGPDPIQLTDDVPNQLFNGANPTRVTSSVNERVKKSGDTMTGNLVMSGADIEAGVDQPDEGSPQIGATNRVGVVRSAHVHIDKSGAVNSDNQPMLLLTADDDQQQPLIDGAVRQGVKNASTLDPFGGLNRRGTYFFDEFVGPAAIALDANIWNVTTSGPSSIAEYISTPPHHARLSAGVAVGTFAQATTHNAGVRRSRNPRFHTLVRKRWAAEDVILRVGFELYYFEYDQNGTGANWHIVVPGDANSPFDTGVAAPTIDGDFQILYFMIVDANNIAWQINDDDDLFEGGLGNGVFTTASPIPDTNTELLMRLEDDSGGGSGDVEIDFIEGYESTRL